MAGRVKKKKKIGHVIPILSNHNQNFFLAGDIIMYLAAELSRRRSKFAANKAARSATRS
jgi:hypothetical protein